VLKRFARSIAATTALTLLMAIIALSSAPNAEAAPPVNHLGFSTGPQTLTAGYVLSSALRHMGRYGDARQVSEDILAWYRRVLGEDGFTFKRQIEGFADVIALVNNGNKIMQLIFSGEHCAFIRGNNELYLTDWQHQDKWLPTDEREWVIH
jgi:hypothetical protein